MRLVCTNALAVYSINLVDSGDTGPVGFENIPGLCIELSRHDEYRP
jgi:hypothetical protein